MNSDHVNFWIRDGCNRISGYSRIQQGRKRIWSLFLILLVSVLLFGQEVPKTGKKKIEVLHSNEGIDEVEKSTGRRLTRLIGDVSLKDDDVLMYCDSAHFYTGNNQIKAFGRIFMQQGDTLSLRGDSLFYDGTTQKASVDGNVILMDRETKLYTNSVLSFSVKRIHLIAYLPNFQRDNKKHVKLPIQ